MHVIVVTVAIDPARADEAEAMLHSTVVPDVKQLPGFVSGTWARSADGTKGHSVVIFENEDAANAAVGQARQGPPSGAPVKTLYAEVYEVIAQA